MSTVQIVFYGPSQNNLTNFAREASQTPLWLQIPNSKLHSLFENATRSAIWGDLAGQKHSDAVWFRICRTWEG